MRISVSSWATTEEDVERSLAAILAAASQAKRGGGPSWGGRGPGSRAVGADPPAGSRGPYPSGLFSRRSPLSLRCSGAEVLVLALRLTA
jgi:hypothetical protein